MLYAKLNQNCQDLLDSGVRSFKMQVGIVSHIYQPFYKVIAISGGFGGLGAGAVIPLGETYCRDVFTSGKTFAMTEFEGEQGLRKHPLYLRVAIEAYLSAPIFHEGKVWGTVNFTSTEFHRGFTATEVKRVEKYAASVGRWLAEMQ